MTSTVIVPLASSVFCCIYYMVGGGGLFLMEQLEVKEDGVWRALGDRCMQVGGGGRNRKSTSRYGTPGAGQVSIETATRGRKATVTITTGSGEKVVEFERGFLTSFETEVTYFVSDLGTEYRLTHWGERDCVAPETQPEAATIAEVRSATAAVA